MTAEVCMKKDRLRVFVLRNIIISVIMALSAFPVFGETLTIPGTGACEHIVGELAAAFNRANPGKQIIVPPSTGTGGGIDSVLKGEAPLARIARALKPAEEKQGLAYMLFARDAVAFAVGSGVKVKNLSTDQLTAIFSGRIVNWKDVGGEAVPIRVITREPGDSSLSVLRERIKGFRDIVFPGNAKVILYDRATVETLDKYRNSIGFITISSSRWAKGGMKTITMDNIAPTAENVISGKYRLVEDYAFTHKKTLPSLAKSFVDFVFSPEGKKIIEKNGLVAVEKR
jgi:phosphate transport system substrate-binding protein